MAEIKKTASIEELTQAIAKLDEAVRENDSSMLEALDDALARSQHLHKREIDKEAFRKTLHLTRTLGELMRAFEELVDSAHQLREERDSLARAAGEDAPGEDNQEAPGRVSNKVH